MEMLKRNNTNGQLLSIKILESLSHFSSAIFTSDKRFTYRRVKSEVN